MKFSSDTIWFNHNWTYFKKNVTYTFIFLFKKFSLSTWLIEPTRFFHFENFSNLHIISNCILIREVRVHPIVKEVNWTILSTLSIFLDVLCLHKCPKSWIISFFAGIYECQVSTTPPRSHLIFLKVAGMHYENRSTKLVSFGIN